MAETIVAPPEQFAKAARFGELKKYRALYDRSLSDTDGFWAEQAERISWFKKWDKVSRWDFNTAKIEWFIGGKLNASYNCLDRHLGGPRKTKAAIIWEGDSPDESRTLTYQDLHREVCRFANGLKSLGVKKGDRVTIYLPMIPEAAVAMLACARIGAPHSVVFGGFSPDSLRDRINDSQSKVVITADGGWRRGSVVALKTSTDEALAQTPSVEKVVVVKRTGYGVPVAAGRDVWWDDVVKDQPATCDAEPVDSEDLLYLLYTSGSTGKPKGIVHTTGGYMTGVYATTKWIFDLKDDDVYWCTADVGWVTGHSYVEPLVYRR